jgi:hypothetical protein
MTNEAFWSAIHRRADNEIIPVRADHYKAFQAVTHARKAASSAISSDAVFD